MKVYKKVNDDIKGKVAIKIHTREPKGPNILPLDMLYDLPEKEAHDLKERIESREGLHQLEYGNEIGIGTREYELVEAE